MNTRPPKILHPAVIILLFIQFLVLLFTAKEKSLIALTIIPLVSCVLFIEKQNTKYALVLARLAILASLFMVLVYGIEFKPLGFRHSWLQLSSLPALRLIGLFAAMFCVSNALRRREIYSFLLECRVPLSIIFIIFKAFWLVPHIRSRFSDIILALRLRGIRMRSRLQRFRALIFSFSALFNSMVMELEESSLALATKGISSKGRKNSLYKLRLEMKDLLVLVSYSSIIQFLFWGL